MSGDRAAPPFPIFHATLAINTNMFPSCQTDLNSSLSLGPHSRHAESQISLLLESIENATLYAWPIMSLYTAHDRLIWLTSHHRSPWVEDRLIWLTSHRSPWAVDRLISPNNILQQYIPLEMEMLCISGELYKVKFHLPICNALPDLKIIVLKWLLISVVDLLILELSLWSYPELYLSWKSLYPITESSIDHLLLLIPNSLLFVCVSFSPTQLPRRWWLWGKSSSCLLVRANPFPTRLATHQSPTHPFPLCILTRWGHTPYQNISN